MSPSHPLTRRASCTISTFDTTCPTHRIILLSIIGFVLILILLILSALYIRHRRRRASRKRLGGDGDGDDVEEGGEWEKTGKRWMERRTWEDPGLTIPPPAYEVGAYR